MKTPKLPSIPPSQITPPERYFSRREIMTGLAGAAALAIGPTAAAEAARLKHTKNARFSLADPPNSREDITTYNNFYEFGTDKGDPARLGRTLPAAAVERRRSPARPRSPGDFTLEDILKPHAARGTHLPAALRRGLVDGGALDRLPARRTC